MATAEPLTLALDESVLLTMLVVPDGLLLLLAAPLTLLLLLLLLAAALPLTVAAELLTVGMEVADAVAK